MLAKWLATSPKVLILDCPTVGVDVGARDGIYRFVRGLAERGSVMIESYPSAISPSGAPLPSLSGSGSPTGVNARLTELMQ